MLHAYWLDGGRKAEHPPDPRYPLGMHFDGTAGGPGCKITLCYPAPCVGKWLIRCDVCQIFTIVTAAGRVDDPHTVRVPCKAIGSA